MKVDTAIAENDIEFCQTFDMGKVSLGDVPAKTMSRESFPSNADAFGELNGIQQLTFQSNQANLNRVISRNRSTSDNCIVREIPSDSKSKSTVNTPRIIREESEKRIQYQIQQQQHHLDFLNAQKQFNEHSPMLQQQYRIEEGFLNQRGGSFSSEISNNNNCSNGLKVNSIRTDHFNGQYTRVYANNQSSVSNRQSRYSAIDVYNQSLQTEDEIQPMYAEDVGDMSYLESNNGYKNISASQLNCTERIEPEEEEGYADQVDRYNQSTNSFMQVNDNSNSQVLLGYQNQNWADHLVFQENKVYSEKINSQNRLVGEITFQDQQVNSHHLAHNNSNLGFKEKEEMHPTTEQQMFEEEKYAYDHLIKKNKYQEDDTPFLELNGFTTSQINEKSMQIKQPSPLNLSIKPQIIAKPATSHTIPNYLLGKRVHNAKPSNPIVPIPNSFGYLERRKTPTSRDVIQNENKENRNNNKGIGKSPRNLLAQKAQMTTQPPLDRPSSNKIILQTTCPSTPAIKESKKPPYYLPQFTVNSKPTSARQSGTSTASSNTTTTTTTIGMRTTQRKETIIASPPLVDIKQNGINVGMKSDKPEQAKQQSEGTSLNKKKSTSYFDILKKHLRKELNPPTQLKMVSQPPEANNPLQSNPAVNKTNGLCGKTSPTKRLSNIYQKPANRNLNNITATPLGIIDSNIGSNINLSGFTNVMQTSILPKENYDFLQSVHPSLPTLILQNPLCLFIFINTIKITQQTITNDQNEVDQLMKKVVCQQKTDAEGNNTHLLRYNKIPASPATQNQKKFSQNNNEMVISPSPKKATSANTLAFNPPLSLQNTISPIRITQNALFDEININQFKIEQEIGKGSYASVKLAIHRTTQVRYALKIYPRFVLLDPHKMRNVKREITILRKLQNPYIIRMPFAFEDKSNQIIIGMEYVGKASLHSFLKTLPERRLPESEAKRLFHQIVTALAYCHEANVVHRDIKLENILLDNQNNIKIIDFGFSIITPEEKKLKIFCGTPSYMAPEIISKLEYVGQKADVWALGILLFAMLQGKFPFKGVNDNDLYKKIKKAAFTSTHPISPEADNLISSLLNIKPNDRPSVKQILEHSWMIGM